MKNQHYALESVPPKSGSSTTLQPAFSQSQPWVENPVRS